MAKQLLFTVQVYRGTSYDREQLRVVMAGETNNDFHIGGLDTGIVIDDGYPQEAEWLRKELLNYVASIDFDSVVRAIK